MIRKTAESFRYAIEGIGVAWREERNFKIEVVCAAVVLCAAYGLGLPTESVAILVLTIAAVLSVEALNTALEELCDKFEPSHDPHIAKIKDLAAASVLIVSLGAAIVGLCLFLPYLYA